MARKIEVCVLCAVFTLFGLTNAAGTDAQNLHSPARTANTFTTGFGNFGLRPPFLPRLSGFVLRLLNTNLRPSLLQATNPGCKFPKPVCDVTSPYRTADGYCNNLKHPAWGSPGWPFKRILPPAYDDGVNEPRTRDFSGAELPSARTVSKLIHTSDSPSMETAHLTSMFTQFGQFLDHDIDLTPLTNGDSELDCCEQTIQFPVRNIYNRPPTTATSYLLKSRPLPGTCFPITVPQPDEIFKKSCMNFVRSKVFAPSFKCVSATREQGNAVTSFIDAFQVYGSSQAVQMSLRELTGGRLKGAGNDLLPSNSSTSCRSSKLAGKFCFGAGDPRVNEQPMLSALHVVFHRYHNYIADRLLAVNQHWDDAKLFQEARKIIGAVMQHIIYTEYLPLLLGNSHMLAYELTSGFFHRYESYTDPRIINSFATAAFRFGHSMVSGHLKFGHTKQPLESMFFCPHKIQDTENRALDDLLRGTLSDLSQGSDRFFAPAVAKKLFEDKTEDRSLDLVSLNIQRGRDHGLPSYNKFREACGLPKLDGTEPGKQIYLGAFRSMDDVDLFSGAMAEEHVPGGIVGDTFACIIARQFRDLKFGDRFWYENTDVHIRFSSDQLKAIKRVTLASLFCSVTNIDRVQPSVFTPASSSNPELPCERISELGLSPWFV